MDNLAYLYLADAYENNPSSELVSLSDLFNTTSAPDWKRLSSKAWKHLLPLLLALSILSSVSSVFALERGDQGPSVRNLQQQLQAAGFYQAPITQVYDFPTEDAVRRFQQAHGLVVDGIVGVMTRQKLDNVTDTVVIQPDVPQIATNTAIHTSSERDFPLPQLTTASTPFDTVESTNIPDTIPQTSTVSTTIVSAVGTHTRTPNPNFLKRGDEGEQVRILQERLRVAGFFSGQATGVFGPITEAAVKQFQEAYQLDVDGIVGPATLQKLPTLSVGGEYTPPRETLNTDHLSVGHQGEAVRLLQSHLMQAGYLQGTPSGYFDSATATAVSEFQAANYLAVSGIAGPTTRAKLYSVLINTPNQGEFSTLEIQRRLREKGFYRGHLNGVMAEDTKQAIKQAQEYYGISLSDIRSGQF
jgi:peptidoglycan hydrolase-like protein with peptidoglycan-binding domain